jgi:microcystin-dependent protein
MRSTRSLALILALLFALTGAGTAAFALTDDGGTSSATKAGRTSKQALAILDRYEAEQAAREQAELDAYLHALAERERFLAGVAAEHERQHAQAARAARERASRAAVAARSATVSRAPAYGPWADLINQYPWPAQTAYNVMMCESGGNANAYNASSGATGLFQILDGPFDPHENVALAFQMWQSRGWQPWRACI